MADEEIPLDITGHEQRDRPGDESDRSLGASMGGSDSNEDSRTDHDGGPEGAIESGDADADEEAESGDADADEEAESGDADENEEVEPVEVLVGLAEEGTIDPWDIDIVAVTDEFLARLDEADLRTSGRALFYASVLLRMKGDALLTDGEEETEEQEPWEQVGGEEPLGDADPFATLEHEIDRRLERKRARGTPQTLDELVRDLREAERDTWWKESREYDTSGSSESYRRGTQELDYRTADEFRMDDEPTEAEVTGNTHGEDIEAIVDDVYAAVRDQYEKGRKEVLFREIESAGESRVTTYLGLLFLSHRGQVRLRQDELFGDLWIQDPAAITGPDEAVAD